MKHDPAPQVVMPPKVQVFPFGRGDRATKQRLVVEFQSRGHLLRTHDVRVLVLHTGGVPVPVLVLGMSKYMGKRRLFGRLELRDAFRELVQAVKNAPEVRRRNKVVQAARKRNKELDN